MNPGMMMGQPGSGTGSDPMMSQPGSGTMSQGAAAQPGMAMDRTGAQGPVHHPSQYYAPPPNGNGSNLPPPRPDPYAVDPYAAGAAANAQGGPSQPGGQYGPPKQIGTPPQMGTHPQQFASHSQSSRSFANPPGTRGGALPGQPVYGSKQSVNNYGGPGAYPPPNAEPSVDPYQRQVLEAARQLEAARAAQAQHVQQQRRGGDTYGNPQMRNDNPYSDTGMRGSPNGGRGQNSLITAMMENAAAGAMSSINDGTMGNAGRISGDMGALLGMGGGGGGTRGNSLFSGGRGSSGVNDALNQALGLTSPNRRSPNGQAFPYFPK